MADIGDLPEEAQKLSEESQEIYEIAKGMAPAKGVKSVKMTELIKQCKTKGFEPNQVESCLEDYEELNVWQVNQSRTRITFT